MSFYYFLLRGWLHLGDSETVVRGLSVLFGVAVIPVTYLLGKRLFGRKAAIASAALSAVNIFQIRYSQEARGYSLVMLLVVLSTYFFLRVIDSPSQKRYWVGYALMSGLAIYSHVFAYLVVLAQWLSLGYARLRLIDRRAAFWTVAGFILLTIPMNAFLLLKNQGQLNWVPRPTVQLLLTFANFFTGNGGIALLAAYAALCLAALLWPSAPEWRRPPSFHRASQHHDHGAACTRATTISLRHNGPDARSEDDRLECWVTASLGGANLWSVGARVRSGTG